MKNKTKEYTPEIWQVHYFTESEEYTGVASIEVDVDEFEAQTDSSKRILILTRGDEPYIPEQFSDSPYIIQTANDSQMHRVMTNDEKSAFAYYVHGVETNGVKKHFLDGLKNKSPDWFSLWNDWCNNLSQRERRLRLLDLLEWRIEKGGDWHAKKYLHELSSSWRSTNISGDAEDMGIQIVNSIDVKHRMCYRTAQKAALLHKDNPHWSDRIKYAEGIVLPSNASQAIRHAWIEIDGEVCEVTWPWHHVDGSDAVYYGLTFPLDRVEEARKSDVGGSVVLSEDESKSINNKLRESMGYDSDIEYSGAT